MTEDIKTAIEATVRERLSDAKVQNVTVTEGEDNEGDRIYRVLVVYDERSGKLDAHRMSGLARHIRARLDESQVFVHPIFRFVSQSDAKKLKSEAA